MDLHRRRKGENGESFQQDHDRGHVSEEKVGLRERLRHFTWAWFAFPLSTGGIGLLMASTPHRFAGLTTIGKIFFIFDIVVYLTLTALIAARFIMNPGTLKASLVHPTEALFFPTFILNWANLIGCMQTYGAPYCGIWFHYTMEVLFWIYVAVSFLAAVIQYLYLFTAPPTRLTIQGMTPAWILPIFPIMLSGTLASLISADQIPSKRLPILVCGIAGQGLGWMVAFLMYSAYIQRLMQYGLPAPDLRPGMFIAVGPPSFTGLALIGMSNLLPKDYAYFARRPMAVEILQVVADFAAIFLWMLAFWFFSLTLIAVLSGARKMTFHLAWWSLVFPNVGFATTTIKIGQQLQSEGILWVSSAMTILLVVLWIFVFVMHVRAVLRRDILMPGKDEDKGESLILRRMLSRMCADCMQSTSRKMTNCTAYAAHHHEQPARSTSFS